jgi:hypothetical protein
MDDRLPLTEVSGDEALARVAYQIIVGDYHAHPETYDTPTEALLNLAHSWDSDGLHLLGEQIALAAIWCANGGTVATWLRARVVFHAGRFSRLHQAGRSRRR